MIVKSMSRKVPSFGQLIGYIDRDEGQEAYRIRHNVLARDPAQIRAEFERNADLLQRRKNGVYLYHEIISITRAKGLSPEAQKERLYEIAQTYIAARCPDNLVFGGLHQDKEHSYHYHLMISANRAGERGRLRLTKPRILAPRRRSRPSCIPSSASRLKWPHRAPPAPRLNGAFCYAAARSLKPSLPRPLSPTTRSPTAMRA